MCEVRDTLWVKVMMVPGYVRFTPDDAGHGVVMNLRTGDLYVLNETGVLIWNSLSRHGSICEAASRVASAYGIPEEQAAYDAAALAEDLLARDLLTLVQVSES